MDGVRAVAGVDAHLIDADRKQSAGIRDQVAVRANQERLRGGGVSHPADDRAAPCSVIGKDANQIFEAASQASGCGVVRGIGVVHLTGDGSDHVLARLNGDSGFRPKLVASELDFLREPALADRRCRRRSGGLLRTG